LGQSPLAISRTSLILIVIVLSTRDPLGAYTKSAVQFQCRAASPIPSPHARAFREVLSVLWLASLDSGNTFLAFWLPNHKPITCLMPLAGSRCSFQHHFGLQTCLPYVLPSSYLPLPAVFPMSDVLGYLHARGWVSWSSLCTLRYEAAGQLSFFWQSLKFDLTEPPAALFIPNGHRDRQTCSLLAQGSRRALEEV
jgi:hypothetical protein